MSKLGVLYIVATPLGNLQDITFRAIEVLKNVDKIAAEDTRHSLPLLKHFGISKPLIALHNFNEKAATQKLLADLKKGASIALISDAGTPLISDPGFHFVHEARALGIQVVPVPGACAAIAALCISGLPTYQFTFAGFLSSKNSEKIKQLEELKKETRTLVFYEAPHRIMETLSALLTVFGPDRASFIARELTKMHETIRQGSIAELISWFEQNDSELRGEFVIVVAGAKEDSDAAEKLIAFDHVLEVLLEELPLKQAVALASKITDVRKNILYDWALKKK